MVDDHEHGATLYGSWTPMIPLLLSFGCGTWLADVMADATVVERPSWNQ